MKRNGDTITPDENEIVVEVSGGVVQSVVHGDGTSSVRVIVFDWDDHEATPDNETYEPAEW